MSYRFSAVCHYTDGAGCYILCLDLSISADRVAHPRLVAHLKVSSLNSIPCCTEKMSLLLPWLLPLLRAPASAGASRLFARSPQTVLSVVSMTSRSARSAA